MILGWDSETHATTRHNVVPPLVCTTLSGFDGYPADLPQHDGLDAVVHEPDEHGIWRAIYTRGAALEVSRIVLLDADLVIAHRTAYDVEVARRACGIPLVRILDRYDEGAFADTMVREQLIRIAQGVPLRTGFAEMVKRRLGVELDGKSKSADRWQLNFHQLEGLPAAYYPEAAREYAIADAYYALRLYLAQTKDRIDAYTGIQYSWENGLITDELPQTCAAYELHLQAAAGMVPLDFAKVQNTLASWRELAEKGLVVGRQRGFVRPDGSRDMKVLQGLTAEAYAVHHAKKVVGEDGTVALLPGEAPMTKGGEKRGPVVQTSREALASSGDPDLATWAEADEYRNYLVKYEDVLSAGGRLCSKPNVLVETGRTSWADPPYQGPPREGGFRECHIAPEGWVVVSVDWNQIELVALAHFCSSMGFGSAMADAINEGIDLHCLMALDLMLADGVAPPEGHEAWTYALVYGMQKTTTVGMYRTLAKAANFGFPGGLSARSLVDFAWNTYRVRITEEQAGTIKRVWLGRFPEMRVFFSFVGEACSTGSFTAVQPFSGRLRGGVTFNNGCNTYFQGPVSDAIKRASWRIRRLQQDPESPLHGTETVLTIHDELLFLMPEDPDKLTAAADLASRVMIETAEEVFPGMRINAPPAACRWWSKKMDEVRDERGRLVPWTPKEKS